jgi:hypothetical protein
VRLALLLVAVVLVPAAAASGASAPFTLGPTDTVTLHLQLDAAASVSLAVRFEVGVARDLTIDGPGACDMDVTASGSGAPGGPGATMGNVRCALPAGTHTFTVHLVAGVVRGSLASSHGRWV